MVCPWGKDSINVTTVKTDFREYPKLYGVSVKIRLKICTIENTIGCFSLSHKILTENKSNADFHLKRFYVMTDTVDVGKWHYESLGRSCDIHKGYGDPW